MPSGFGGRGGSDVSTNHIFLQGVLAALVGGGAGGGKARSRAVCELRLLLYSGTCTTLLMVGVGSQDAGVEALRVMSELAPFPLSVCSPSS